MGDAQRLSPADQLRYAREQFEVGPDLTVAAEEEFALIDRETLELTPAFLDLQRAAAGGELEEHLVGEVILSEVEVRTGRCDTFADAAARMGERRAQLRVLADQLGIGLASTGAHPWSDWRDQKLIDTPHYRRNDEILHYVLWRNNTFGLHVHIGINGPDRAVAVCDALRNFLPELLALSASSPFVDGVFTHLHSARTQIFTRTFPRCGIPEPYGDWRGFEQYVQFLYDTGSVDEHTQLWWSVRPHLGYPTVELRIMDAQPDLGEARAIAALGYSLAARCARAFDEDEPLPSWPGRLLEENLWRAIRDGISGELLDLEAGRPIPARARIEQLIEWVLPVAEELGAAQWLSVPERNSAERQVARHDEGASMEEIFREQIRAGERVES